MKCVDCGEPAHGGVCDECKRPLCYACQVATLDFPPGLCVPCVNGDLKETLAWERAHGIKSTTRGKT